MNSTGYKYNSFPVLINLAESFNEEYNVFLKLFKDNINVTDFPSSYAMFKLSNYMLNHLDFERAKEAASIALKYNADQNFELILQKNYSKINWFYENARRILKNTIIN
jgi:hypothetical protein